MAATVALPAFLDRWLDEQHQRTKISGAPQAFDDGHFNHKRLIGEALARHDFQMAVCHTPDPARWWMLDYCVGMFGITPETIEAFEYLWIHGSWLQHGTVDRRCMTTVINALARSRLRSMLFSPNDLITFDRLPERFTVYRGVFDGGYGMRIPGRSWTLSEDIAEKFARRFTGKDLTQPTTPGVVMEKCISKDDVLFFSSARGEQEIVLIKPTQSAKRKEYK